jgi:hypothetical protein
LLHPAGTIFSAGWFRDYKMLWDARSQLVDSERVKELDAANAQARTTGLRVGIDDLAGWIGPEFRVVAARQRETVYQRKLDERLPAVALVVGLRDEEAVRNRILAPAEGLLLVGLGNKIVDYKKIDYQDSKLTTFRFADNLDENDPGKSVLYNFNPAYAISRAVSGPQLILGSTAEIVRDLVDDLEGRGLERQGPAGASPDAGGLTARPTGREQLSLTELSEFLKGFQKRLERDAINRRGLSPADATREVELFHQLLERLESLTASSAGAPDHFDIHIRLGPEGK